MLLMLWSRFLLLSCLPLKDVVLPERSKLKFMNKVPNLKKAKKEMKKLRDIQGPAKTANSFTTGQYAIVVSAFLFCKSYDYGNCMKL